MTESEAFEGRVIRAQSGFYIVESEHGTHTAVLRGRFKKERRSEGLIALGDRVLLRRLELPEGESGKVDAVIDDVLPRESALMRRAPGPKGVWAQDVVVANVDQLVPVFAARSPDPHFGMLDRFLALAAIDAIDSLIVINKVDLGLSAEVTQEIETYRRAGYRVILASTRSGEGIDALRDALSGCVSAVVGPSGVGKSSLLNAVEPGLDIRVAEISQAVQKGRHTTRVGELHRLRSGGLVADTPGLRELAVWQVDPGELEWAFIEFRPFINTCRFYDCTHVHEPGCAVKEALERGEIDSRRYDSYLRLLGDESN